MGIASSSEDTERQLASRSTLAPAQSVAAVTHDGRTVLLEQRCGRYYGLSDVGARIWELVQQRVSPLEIVNRLESEYEIDRDRLVQDTAALLGALLGAGLIRWE